MVFFKLIFCLIFLLPPSISGKNICRASSCGKNIFPVKFPFRLQDQQPTNCGYPGFVLGCNNQGIVTLKLPQSEKFFVQNIDYMTQEIRLYDPNGCMAKRLPELDLLASPSTAASYINFSFLSCPTNSSRSSTSFVVNCLSNSANMVLAVPSVNDSLYSSECHQFFDHPIQLPESFWTYLGIFYSIDDFYIPLTWNIPDCRRCESIGSTCGFGTDQRVKCLGSPPTAAKGAKILGLVSLFVIIGGFAVSFIICFTRARRMSTAATTTTTAAATTTTTAQFQNFHPPTGLDETTIQSYTKVVLGESCRLPGSHTSDGSCPICLSEYSAKDTVKCIPECTHIFHADCIDEWLRLTGSCPVCRKTPTPSPSHATSL